MFPKPVYLEFEAEDFCLSLKTIGDQLMQESSAEIKALIRGLDKSHVLIYTNEVGGELIFLGREIARPSTLEAGHAKE